MKRIISSALILFHLLFIVPVTFSQPKKQMIIKRVKGKALVAFNLSADAFDINSIFVIKKTKTGQMIGMAQVMLIKDNIYGFKVTNLASSAIVEINDILVLHDPSERFDKAVADDMITTLEYNKTIVDISEDNLTDIQKKEYNKSRLSIELSGAGYVPSNVGFGTGMYSSWRKWDAYEGFLKLSEESFFHKTGYLNEAKLAKSYKNTSDGMIGGGLIGIVIGGILYYRGYTRTSSDYIFGQKYEYSDPNWGVVSIGSVLGLLGGIMMTAGLIRLNKNWAAYATVNGIAEDYNKSLRFNIQKSF